MSRRSPRLLAVVAVALLVPEAGAQAAQFRAPAGAPPAPRPAPLKLDGADIEHQLVIGRSTSSTGTITRARCSTSRAAARG